MAAPHAPEVAAALAAFAIADLEHQAELAGREYSLDDSKIVAQRFGVDATRVALIARGEMLQGEAADLTAWALLRRARGAA